MDNQARGYIASGTFNGYRIPQHIQNQIIRSYCSVNNMTFVLSRAEYWMDEHTTSQLWAALRERYSNIVFFSIWQMPRKDEDRKNIYHFIKSNHINIHFASERIKLKPSLDNIDDIELLLRCNITIGTESEASHLVLLRNLL